MKDIIDHQLVTMIDSKEFDSSKEMAKKSLIGAPNEYAKYISKK